MMPLSEGETWAGEIIKGIGSVVWACGMGLCMALFLAIPTATATIVAYGGLSPIHLLWMIPSALILLVANGLFYRVLM